MVFYKLPAVHAPPGGFFVANCAAYMILVIASTPKAVYTGGVQPRMSGPLQAGAVWWLFRQRGRYDPPIAKHRRPRQGGV